jgi:hypothetical protein
MTRAEVPGSVLWLAACAAFLVLTMLVCGGAFAMMVASAADQRASQFERELADQEAVRIRIEDADLGLQSVAELLESVRFEEREYPLALPELPPEDPWGTPIRYSRHGPESALLSSAGPDRVFQTADDRVLSLPLE